MKRIISFALILIMLIGFLYGCVGTPETTAADTTETEERTETEEVTEMPVETDEIITAPDEDAGLTAWYAHSFIKTDPDRPEDTGLRSYTVFMAKAETENAQIVLSADSDKTGLSVSCGPLKNKDGAEISAEIYRQYYVKCGQVRYPDPVAPMNDTTRVFDIEKGKSQALFIRLNTQKDTPAGDYEGVVSVCEGDKTVKQLRLFAHVWDVTMPEVMTASAVSGMGPGDIYRFHNNDGEKDYYKEYYDFLLQYHVNAYDLPYDILDERADAYMSDPRVKFFRVSYVGDDERMVAWYNKLKTNEEWLKKAYFYPYDEPGSASALNDMAGKCARIRQLCPGVKIVVPFFQNVQYDKDRDQIAFMSEYIDIWCPKTFCFTKQTDKAGGKRMLYSASQKKKYTEFGQRMSEEVAGGDELWWYVCWEPGLPYLNMYVDMTGLQNKLLFWQQKQYGVSGFLYWSCTFWERVEDPWTNMATVGKDYRTGQSWLSDKVFGDGSLLYPGTDADVDGACGSFRLEMIRDGMDEFEMLTMLEAAAGKDKADAIISTVSTSVVKFTDDNEAMAAARIQLGNALEEALKNK
ncbi:MAG: DUF4091 domain-containing protein [Clostridia bacterium]|nr:DUF4091 domain-containing protein [Clostridia bacterium]